MIKGRGEWFLIHSEILAFFHWHETIVTLLFDDDRRVLKVASLLGNIPTLLQSFR